MEGLAKPSKKTELGNFYRAACILHTWSVGISGRLLPAFITATELMIIGTLYISIRLNLDGSTGVWISLILGSVSVGGLMKLKTDFSFTARMTDRSINFKEMVNLEEARITPEDRRFLNSCIPIRVKVGGIFTITQQSFITIAQDVVLTNLINLLVLY